MLRAVLVLPVLLLFPACGEAREIREWTPEDHAHPQQADPSRVPQPPDQDGSEERAAAALWIMSCATCHGREGRGDGPGLPPNARTADFTDPAWQASKSDEELGQVILEGRGPMPRFGDRINPRGIAALVGHIRRMNPEHPPEEDPGERDPTEGEPGTEQPEDAPGTRRPPTAPGAASPQGAAPARPPATPTPVAPQPTAPAPAAPPAAPPSR